MNLLRLFKKNYFLKTVTFFLLFLLLLSLGTSPDIYSRETGSYNKVSPGKRPFPPGEKMVFDLSWFGISAGSAVMRVENNQTEDETISGDTFLITSTATTNKTFSFFFPVEDKVQTLIDQEGLFPYFLKMNLSEGKRKRKREIYFDQDNHKVLMKIFRKDKKPKETAYEIPPKAHNSLSAFYFLRSQKSFTPGETLYIDVHEGGKNWRLEIDVLGKEILKTPSGAIPAYKMKANVKFEGLFMDKGDVFIWLSDDDKRLPLLIKCKISFGTVVARLIEAKF